MTNFEFANRFYSMSLENKFKTHNKLKEVLKKPLQPDGKEWTPSIKQAIVDLERWCGMNIFLGEMHPVSELGK